MAFSLFKIESWIKSRKGILDEKRIFLPSGDHFGLLAPYFPLVNCNGSPPSIDRINSWLLSATERVKAICLPSGLHAGLVAPSKWVVSCFGAALPSIVVVKICVRYL